MYRNIDLKFLISILSIHKTSKSFLPGHKHLSLSTSKCLYCQPTALSVKMPNRQVLPVSHPISNLPYSRYYHSVTDFFNSHLSVLPLFGCHFSQGRFSQDIQTETNNTFDTFFFKLSFIYHRKAEMEIYWFTPQLFCKSKGQARLKRGDKNSV